MHSRLHRAYQSILTRFYNGGLFKYIGNSNIKCFFVYKKTKTRICYLTFHLYYLSNLLMLHNFFE